MNKRTSKQQETAAQDVRAAIYLRVSTSEQADSGLGLAAQEARCKGMAEAKGWPAPVIYKDEGISGTLGRDKRPALDLLMAAIEAGQVNAVIVLDLSRLARKTKLVLDLLEVLDQHGAAFVSCKEGFDTSTAQGRFVLTMFAALGQLERDLISERTTAALDERRKAHGYASGRLPLGYVRTGEAITIDDQQAALVRRIFAERDDRGATMREIAGGLGWHHSRVQSVLNNERVYRGQVERWPAILQ